MRTGHRGQARARPGANGAASATRPGAPPACAPDAAAVLPSRRARRAGLAARGARPPSASCTPPAGPPGCAADAAPPHGRRLAPCAVLEYERGDAERKNEAGRRRYWARRAASRCTDCNAPSQGASRCDPCARRSYERSDHFRGLPIYPPTYTVVLLDSDEPLGVFDDEMEVAAYLAPLPQAVASHRV